MDKFNHLKTGRKGENIAEEILKEKGYKIIERNRKSIYGETDIIAEDRGVLVFVEVRAKTGVNFGLPEETITFFKKKKLIKNAKRYIYYKKEKRKCRIDIISIIFKADGLVFRKKHYKNITLY